MGVYANGFEALAACLFPMMIAFAVGIASSSWIKQHVAQTLAVIIGVVAMLTLTIMMFQATGAALSDEKQNMLFYTLLLFMLAAGVLFEHRDRGTTETESRFTVAC